MHFWSGSNVKPDEITDIPAYNRENGLMWTIYAAAMVLAGVLSLFYNIAGVIIMVILMVPGIPALILVYNRIYNKYRNPSFTPAGNDIASSKTSNYGIIKVIFTVIILFGVGVLFYFGEKEPDVKILNDGIQITGMYGLSIDYSEITDINLLEKSMKEIGIGRRTNGYGGFGDALKGNFRSDALGETLLFVRANSSPTIKIERANKKDIYLSFHDTEKTNKIFNELHQAYTNSHK